PVRRGQGLDGALGPPDRASAAKAAKTARLILSSPVALPPSVDDLHPPVLLPSVGIVGAARERVGRGRPGGGEAARGEGDALQTFALDQPGLYRLGAAGGEGLVIGRRSLGVGVALDAHR